MNKKLKSAVVILVVALGVQTFYLWQTRRTLRALGSPTPTAMASPVKIDDFQGDRAMTADSNMQTAQDMGQLRHEVDRMFPQRPAEHEKAPGLSGFSMLFHPTQPRMKETPTDYIFSWNVSGLDTSGLNVQTTGRMIVIPGLQAVPLPEDANSDGISVEYKDGTLMVKVPKEAETANNYLKKVRMI